MMAESFSLSRRAALGLGLGGAVLALSSACTPGDRPAKVTVAGGEPGGFYLEFATLLAALLQKEGAAHTAEPLITGGSLENILRLVSGEATFGVALADAAAKAVNTGEGNSGAGDVVALGKVYQNYVHCLVRADSNIRAFTDVAGRTVGVGEVGSGTSLTAPRILEAWTLSSVRTPAPVVQVNLGLNQGLAALRDRSIDALFWSGGVPTAAIASTASDIGLRLLDLSELIQPTRARFGPYYDRVLIPADSYGNAPAAWTVGVANLLLCRRDLADQVVRQTVELMVGKAQDLVPKSSTGVQFLSPETLINTAGVPLHPGAAAAYRALHG